MILSAFAGRPQRLFHRVFLAASIDAGQLSCLQPNGVVLAHINQERLRVFRLHHFAAARTGPFPFGHSTSIGRVGYDIIAIG